MPLQASDVIAVEMRAKTWQALSIIVGKAVSPLDIETTAQAVGEWQMALARAERAALDAQEAAAAEAKKAEERLAAEAKVKAKPPE